MKLVRIRIPEHHVIGIEHPGGRVERLALSVVDNLDAAGIILGRTVDAFNACDGIPDAALKSLAAGGDQDGTLNERALLARLLHRQNSRLFRALMEQVRAATAKEL